MKVDNILSTFNEAGADYILIGGMNFFFKHEQVLTWDVDFWIAGGDANLAVVHRALTHLQAEVSLDRKGEQWRAVAELPSGEWLKRQAVHCLHSPHGPIDIFLHVPGLEDGFETLKVRCGLARTPSGVAYRSLSDELMIRCQLALPPQVRKLDRLRALGYKPGAT